MNVYAYIGVAVGAGLLVGLVALSVAWTARTVSKSIRDKSISLLSTYDDLLEERSRRLSWVNEEIRRREEALSAEEEEERPIAPETAALGPGAADFLRATERVCAAGYQDGGAGELYRRVSEEFVFSPQRVLSEVNVKNRKTTPGPATRLLGELPYDTVYGLSTLPGEEQLSLLREALPASGRELLEEYAASREPFDSVAFRDFLTGRAAEEPGPVVLRVPLKDADREYPAQVRVVPDRELCEGMQVEVDNTLYDYSVKAREIG